MLTRFSLLLIALLGVLPYVSTIKLPPIPSFWAEWAAVVLAGAWLASLRRPVPGSSSSPVQSAAPPLPARLAVPWAVVAFAALGVTILVQLMARMPLFRGEPLMTICALVLASLVCLAGARLRAAGEVARLLDAWSIAVLVAMLLNLAAVLLERQGLHLYIYQWGWRTPPDRSEGLLGQANQLAVFAALAGASALYLWMRGKLPSAGLVLASLCATLLIASSASRAGSVLWIVMTLFGALALRDHPRRAVGWRLLALGVVLFVVTQATWTLLDPGGSTSIAALRADRGGSRAEMLRDSWELIRRHPWVGVGYANFMSARWTQLTGSLFEPAANHAHNLVLEMAAELGVVPALLVLLPLAWGLWSCGRVVTRRGVAPEQFLAATVALILAAYSLVEYPLWYTFFLLPFALALGLVEQRDLRVAVTALTPPLRRIGWAAAGAVCVVLALDYHRSEEMYSSLELQQREGHGALVTIPLQETSRIASLSAFDVYSNLMYSRALAPDGLFMAYKLDISERAMLSMTNQETIARQIALLVVADDAKAAQELLDRTRRNPDVERATREVLGRLAHLHPKLEAFVKTLPALPPAA